MGQSGEAEWGWGSVIALLLSTLLSSSFNLVVRWGQGRKANLLCVGAINYVVAAGVYAVAAAVSTPRCPSDATLSIGVAGGVAYVVAYFFLLPSLRLRGVSIPSALVRLSVLTPVLLSMAVWHERPTLAQSSGMVLALASLPLLGYRPGEAASVDWGEYRPLAGLFVLNGLCMAAVKAFQVYGPAEEGLLFFLLLFGTAAVICVGACMARHAAPGRQDWLPGVLLGLCNIGGNFLLLAALQQLPGVVVFPFSSAVGLLYTVLMAHWLWRERMAGLERVGIALATVAVVLVVSP